MFEDRKYHSYQTEGMVKKLLSMNDTLKKNSAYYAAAGKKYNVSPLFLASKSYSELGTSKKMMDGHTFTYKGVKYKNCYNAYNIGATDTLGPVGGLIYANGGLVKKNYTAGKHTSYGRKWSTPKKAIYGGAKFLKKSFIGQGQPTVYTEHFNVLNGPDAVGTHVYMTAINAGISMAGLVSERYIGYGIDEKPLVFTKSAAAESGAGADRIEFTPVAMAGQSAVVAAVERGGGAGRDLALRPTRLVVVGDPAFVVNGQLAERANANRDFFMNIVAYLSGSDQSGADGREPGVFYTGMDREAKLRFLAFSSAVVPLAVLFVMLFVVARRRHRK